MRTILRNTLMLCSLIMMGWGFTSCKDDELVAMLQFSSVQLLSSVQFFVTP